MVNANVRSLVNSGKVNLEIVVALFGRFVLKLRMVRLLMTRLIKMNLPYYRKLTLVLIKVFEINAKGRETYFPIKEINAKEVVTFQNEGN